LREVLPEAQKFEGGSIKHDISVPVAAIPRFIIEASAEVERLVPGARSVPFGHFGDGNIHFNVSQPKAMDKAAFIARSDDVTHAVHAIVLELGGSISAEHGIGRMKAGLLETIKEPVELEMMRRIKAAFDPRGILNPGKVISCPSPG
jgi:FAD/FMN-containing dehydrogenase